MADIQPARVRQTNRNVLAVVEHHLLVLLVGAAIGVFATVQFTAHQDAKTQAAVHDALKAVATPAAVAAVPKP